MGERPTEEQERVKEKEEKRENNRVAEKISNPLSCSLSLPPTEILEGENVRPALSKERSQTEDIL